MLEVREIDVLSDAKGNQQGSRRFDRPVQRALSRLIRLQFRRSQFRQERVKPATWKPHRLPC